MGMRPLFATKRWLASRCRLAMPHILFIDPRTHEETAFDANLEFMGGDETPPGWEEGDWETYLAFLEKHYETRDKKKILMKMYADDSMPVWDRRERKIRIVAKDDVHE